VCQLPSAHGQTFYQSCWKDHQHWDAQLLRHCKVRSDAGQYGGAMSCVAIATLKISPGYALQM